MFLFGSVLANGATNALEQEHSAFAKSEVSNVAKNTDHRRTSQRIPITEYFGSVLANVLTNVSVQEFSAFARTAENDRLYITLPTHCHSTLSFPRLAPDPWVWVCPGQPGSSSTVCVLVLDVSVRPCTNGVSLL